MQGQIQTIIYTFTVYIHCLAHVLVIKSLNVGAQVATYLSLIDYHYRLK